jgi:hypothetical protein
MSRADAAATLAAARAAHLPLGAFVAGLVAGVPVLTSGDSTREHVAALVTSNAKMATLARHLGRLATLLGQGSVQAASELRETLDGIAHSVREHLALAGRVLTDLGPRRGPAGLPDPFAVTRRSR